MIVTGTARPTVIRAVRWSVHNLAEIQELLRPDQSPSVSAGWLGVSVPTAEAWLTERTVYVNPGGWVVKDAAGRVSVFDEETFGRLYAVES